MNACIFDLYDGTQHFMCTLSKFFILIMAGVGNLESYKWYFMVFIIKACGNLDLRGYYSLFLVTAYVSKLIRCIFKGQL
jgi:hypothetical protein